MCFEGSGQGREVEAVDDLGLKVKFNGEGALARPLLRAMRSWQRLACEFTGVGDALLLLVSKRPHPIHIICLEMNRFVSMVNTAYRKHEATLQVSTP